MESVWGEEPCSYWLKHILNHCLGASIRSMKKGSMGVPRAGQKHPEVDPSCLLGSEALVQDHPDHGPPRWISKLLCCRTWLFDPKEVAGRTFSTCNWYTRAVYSQLRPITILLHTTSSVCTWKHTLPMKIGLSERNAFWPWNHVLRTKTCGFWPLKFLFAHENFVLCTWKHVLIILFTVDLHMQVSKACLCMPH